MNIKMLGLCRIIRQLREINYANHDFLRFQTHTCPNILGAKYKTELNFKILG